MLTLALVRAGDAESLGYGSCIGGGRAVTDVAFQIGDSLCVAAEPLVSHSAITDPV